MTANGLAYGVMCMTFNGVSPENDPELKSIRESFKFIGEPEHHGRIEEEYDSARATGTIFGQLVVGFMVVMGIRWYIQRKKRERWE